MKKVVVKGIAVKSGKSKNNVIYTDENLKATAHELADKPILKDHKSLTDNVVGRTTKAEFKDGGIHFEGWVTDAPTLEKLQDGRIKEVSIGAIVERLVKESEDSEAVIAEGIHYLELSTTPTPGVCGTSIIPILSATESLPEGFNIKKIPEKTAEVQPMAEQDAMLEENRKLKEQLTAALEARKADVIEQIMTLTKEHKAEALKERSEAELKVMLAYERKLAIAPEAKAESKSQVSEARKEDANIVRVTGEALIAEHARMPGRIIVETQRQGKVMFWKVPDYSKQGFKLKVN